MSELGQIPAAPSAKIYWWKEAWAAARLRFVATAKELILSVETLSALAIFYLFSRLMIIVGVPEDSVKRFQRLDYWLMFAVFASFGILFLLEILVGLLNEFRKLRTGKL